MAAQKHEATFVGLDIGSSNIICVVGLHQTDLATPSIIGIGSSKVNGIKRGVVTDVEETVSAITAALEEAERMSGIAIDRATINIDGSNLQSLNTNGVIAVARADHEIGVEDLARVEDVASGINLEANRQIVSIIPKTYSVDDHRDVEEPIGMNGMKLELEAHIITASTSAIKNLQNAIFRSGIAIDQQIPTPISAARALLDKQKKEHGVAVVHLGSETTGIAVYQKGVISYTSILPLGSSHITKDLVYGLRITPEVAEKLKVDHSIATKPRAKTNKKINLEQYGAAGNVYQIDIDTIVSSRLEEIFAMISDELHKAVKTPSNLGAGVILTGGGANMPEITNFARNNLSVPVQLGRPSGYSGISEKISDPAYSSVIGLMLSDMDAPPEKPKYKGIKVANGLFSKVKSIVKGLIP